MIITEIEDRFIRQSHPEFGLLPMGDLRKIGCPEGIYARVIERRAVKIATKLQEFRAAHRVAESSLQNDIQAAKLF